MTRRKSAWPLLLLLFAGSKAIARHGLTLAQIRAVAASAGFPDPDLAAAIAMAESGGNATAVGDFGTSFGLWQIHTPAHPEYSPSALFSPAINAAAAYAISRAGADWSPWSVFKDGSYRRYLLGAS